MPLYLYDQKPGNMEEFNKRGDCYLSLTRHCQYCGNDTIGVWKFPNYEIEYDGVDYVGREMKYHSNPYEYFFATGNLISDSEIREYATYVNGNYKCLIDKKYELFTKIATIPDYLYQYRNEAKEFSKLTTCPICGKLYDNKSIMKTNIIFYDGYFIEATYSEKTDANVELGCDSAKMPSPSPLKAFAKFVEKTRKRYSNIESFITEKTEKNLDESMFDNINSLCEYLTNILKLEEMAYSISTRILDMCSNLDVKVKERDKKRKANFTAQTKARRTKIANAWLEVYNTRIAYQNAYEQAENIAFSIDEIPIILPEKPEAPVKPDDPIIKRPGLFNKKKTIEYNNRIQKEYKDALNGYEKEYALYLEKLEDYNKTVEKLERQREETYLEKKKELAEKNKSKYEKYEMEYNDAQEKLKKLLEYKGNESKEDILESDPYYILVKDEITQANETLSNIHNALADLYSYSVIPKKYRYDIVAISSIYEYLSSRICLKLYGVDGAFNKYETDLQTNKIICQLSQINEQLEQIKLNQRMIYSAIEQTNKEIKKLNTSMNKALVELANISSNTMNISSNTSVIADNAAVTAHNTAVTAYYAKKNAELTNALGYLVALS